MESILLGALLLSLIIAIGSCCTSVTPSSYTALEAEDIKFVCILDCACPMVTWAGPALSSSQAAGRVEISGAANTKLGISAVRYEDIGEYSCSCNGGNSTAYLEVNRVPSSHQNTTKTIQEGNEAIISCPGYPGDPPSPVTWQFNFSSVPERYVQDDNLGLWIERVQMEDAGIYTCIFDGPQGQVPTYIKVNVEPASNGIRFLEPVERDVVLEYTEPLNLTCRVDSSSTHPVNLSWIGPGLTTQTSTLVLQPGEVITGLYECRASNNNNNNIILSRSVRVTVNAKPVFPESRTDRIEIVRASEGGVLERHEMTNNRAPAYDRTTTIQWRKKDSGDIVNFGNRLHVSWTENHVTWSIRPASLEDNGQYIMNVSNQFGGTALLTTLKVTMVPKRVVFVELSGQSCMFLKNHKLELARDIAASYSFCKTTCDDSLLETGTVDCKDDTSAIVSLSIPVDYYDPLIKVVTFSLGTSPEFTGTVIEAPPTTDPDSPPTPKLHISFPSGVIAPVVAIASVSMVIVLALVLTIIFRKKLKCKRKEAINPEDPKGENKDEVMCTAYVSVKQKEDVPVVPSSPVSPNGMPITPVYIPPSPTPENGATPLPQGTSKPATERPKKLYFRSYSYSYSGRTPPDHRSRQH